MSVLTYCSACGDKKRTNHNCSARYCAVCGNRVESGGMLVFTYHGVNQSVLICNECIPMYQCDRIYRRIGHKVDDIVTDVLLKVNNFDGMIGALGEYDLYIYDIGHNVYAWCYWKPDIEKHDNFPIGVVSKKFEFTKLP
jgi:hypothetical protein